MSSNGPQAGSVGETPYQVAVLVPCYNEEHAIAEVVAGFRAALPEAAVYVYDNNSTDGTVEAARGAGAVVRRETYQGKGHVVRRMFNDVEADVYVLVDGDATYDAPSAPAMIAKLVEERLDMVVAARIDRETAAYRRGHRSRQPAPHRVCRPYVRAVLQRNPVRLSGVLAPFHEILSNSLRRVRDRNRATIHALELELPVARLRRRIIRDPRIGIGTSTIVMASVSCGRFSNSTAPSGRCRCSVRLG